MASYKCARWLCKRNATYEKPLCHAHWVEWENWGLEECDGCHWFYGDEEITFLIPGENGPVTGKQTSVIDPPPFLCEHCTILTQREGGVLDQGFRDAQRTISNPSMEQSGREEA
jgi:hypothetical protein